MIRSNDRAGTVFYFSPHQDDELLDLGVPICRDIDEGRDVFCVLCTDGGASGARRMLCDGGTCGWHQGLHSYPMNIAEFSAARDREFIHSCLAMGIRMDHILIPEARAKDGQLTAVRAAEIMREAIGGFPPEEICIKTLAEVTWRHQNPDHSACARAALHLRSQGACASVEEYLESLLFPAPDDYPVIEMLHPSDDQRKRLLNAAAGYCLWAPETGAYAVGFHSVADEFMAFRNEQISRPLIRV